MLEARIDSGREVNLGLRALRSAEKAARAERLWATEKPPMPAMGESLNYCDHEIVRVEALRFTVRLASGKRKSTTRQMRNANSAFIAALNIARREAGMERLPKPCATCGEGTPVVGGTYCSTACQQAAHKHEEPRSDIKVLEHLRPIQEAYLTRFVPKQEPVKAEVSMPEAHLLRTDREKADELIRRKGGKVPYTPPSEIAFWQREMRSCAG